MKCNFEIAQIDPCINSTLNICPVSDFLTLFSMAEPLHPVEETYFGWLVHCNCISFILPLLGSLTCKSIPLLLGIWGVKSLIFCVFSVCSLLLADSSGLFLLLSWCHRGIPGDEREKSLFSLPHTPASHTSTPRHDGRTENWRAF